MNNKAIGKIGEDMACEYLIKKGFTIIERNKRFSRYCEIDIIAEHKKSLVFVEVKTRSTDFCGSPLEAITKTKLNHITHGLYTYLDENKNTYKRFRIDIIGIILKPEMQITHLENISL